MESKRKTKAELNAQNDSLQFFSDFFLTFKYSA